MGTRIQHAPTPAATAEVDRSGSHLTIYLAGELDAASAPSVSQTIGDHVVGDEAQVSIDLSELTFCDSSGIVLLVRLHKQVTANRGRFALYHPTAPVRRVLDLCDLTGELNIR